MDDQALIDRLRSDLQAERAATLAPEALHVSGHRRWQRRRARRARVGAALAVLVVVAGATVAAAHGGDESSVRTRRWGSGVPTPTTTEPEGPSQSPTDAARDGVDPAVAALPASQRVTIDVWSSAPPEGRFVISGGASEVLLLDERTDAIAKAFPMGELTPTWLHVTGYEVFGGRIGDAADPRSTVFRIDRRTQEISGFVFGGAATMPTGLWPAAPAGVDLATLVTVGIAGDGERAVPWNDEIRVDQDGLRALFGLPPF